MKSLLVERAFLFIYYICMIDETKYDAILCVEEPTNESMTDKRMAGNTGTFVPGWGSKNGYLDYLGPEVTGAFTFGKAVKQGVESNDMSCEVSDFGPWISVRVTASNVATGRTASKTFLIVFQHKSRGIVMSTSNKWRTIDGWQQAVSYIRSASSSLRGACDSVL